MLRGFVGAVYICEVLTIYFSYQVHLCVRVRVCVL